MHDLRGFQLPDIVRSRARRQNKHVGPEYLLNDNR